MQRAQPTRSSTLIDADVLHQNARGIVPRPELHRNPSSREPLLDFAADPVPGTKVQARPQMGRAGSGLPNSRSVFGVDEVWEKELAKLQKIEALEKVEEEERKKLEAEEIAREQAKAAKKAAKKNKGKANAPPLDTTALHGQSSNQSGGISPIARAPQSAPLLPVVDPFAMPPKQKSSDSDSDSDSDVDKPLFSGSRNRMPPSNSQQDWLSDDERQAVAARPRPRPRQQKSAPVSSFAAGLHVRQSDSDDSDAPLTSALAKAKQRQQAEDSEEDKPLAAVLSNSISTLDFGGTLLADVKKSIQKSPSHLRPPATRNLGNGSDDEDDKPLGLRSPGKVSRVGGDSDDEQPLGMRYSMAPSQVFAQQHQQQFMMQQQMMQQQMMAAAQMRGSMFNPMMMGNMNMGFGNMPMAMPPMAVAEPPVDPAKFGAVDRWRRGVGGETEG